MIERPTQLVQIEKPIYGGACLARVEGKAVFVPMTLPGEQAQIRIIEDKKSFANAEVEEIVQSAPERIEPACRHFGVCGGCSYQHAEHTTQLHMKETILRETLARGGVQAPEEIEILAGDPWGYRNRIRLAFDPAGRVGYRGRRSHAIVPMEECPIAAPELVAAALAIAATLREKAPHLRPTELALFCNPDATKILASLAILGNTKVPIDKLGAELQQRIPALTGFEVITEDLRAEQPRVIGRFGDTSLSYQAAGFGYRVDQGAFFQVNRWLVDALVDRVATGHRGRLAWDLFAGVGLFARKLSESFERVIAVESAPQSTAALAVNLNGSTAKAKPATTLNFLRAAAVKQKPDFMVVDPPRTGLGPDIARLVAATEATAITYVSCDPATLARDLKMLATSGYAIKRVTLADLFPQTFHLESVVELQRT